MIFRRKDKHCFSKSSLVKSIHKLCKGMMCLRTFCNFHKISHSCTNARAQFSIFVFRRAGILVIRRESGVHLCRCCFARGVTAKSPRNVICVRRTRFRAGKVSIFVGKNVFRKPRRRPPRKRAVHDRDPYSPTRLPTRD